MKDNIFNQINNDNIAYWLGFIAADGAIVNYRKKIHFQFGLASKDREHLEKFCLFIEEPITSIYDKKVKSSNNKYYSASYLELFSDVLVKDLAKYGIVQNKSHKNIDFLSYIPEPYKISFILGLFDGDGWFTCTEKTQNFGFCGNQKTIISVHKYLHNYFSTWNSVETIHQYSKSLITYHFQITTKTQIKEFCNFYLTHQNKCDLLVRKKEIAKKLICILNTNKQKQKTEELKQIIKICPICKKTFFSSYTYCSQECVHKAQQKCQRPTRNELKQLIRNKSFLEIGRLYNVSDNAIRKWCVAENLPSKKKDINIYNEEDWDKI